MVKDYEKWRPAYSPCTSSSCFSVKSYTGFYQEYDFTEKHEEEVLIVQQMFWRWCG